MNSKLIAYCGRASAGCGNAVGVKVSVGNAVWVGGTSVGEGSGVSVDRIGAGVADPQATRSKAHKKENPVVILEYDDIKEFYTILESNKLQP